MLETGTKLEDIVYVNFDDERLRDMKATDFDLILQAYHSMNDGNPVLFFDEIQRMSMGGRILQEDLPTRNIEFTSRAAMQRCWAEILKRCLAVDSLT